MPHTTPLGRLWRTTVLALGMALCPLAFGRELTIAFAGSMPPYVLKNGKGIAVELTRTALEDAGHRMVPVVVPFWRLPRTLQERQVDGVVGVQQSAELQAHYSDNFIQFHDHAIALKSRHLNLRSMEDLAGKTVLAFQNASQYLGAHYAQVVANNPHYRETARQDSQVHMLLLGRVDVVVMDELIFRHHRADLETSGKVDATAQVDMFKLFAPADNRAAFADADIRDAFDRQMAAMRKDGRFDAIVRRYTPANLRPTDDRNAPDRNAPK